MKIRTRIIICVVISAIVFLLVTASVILTGQQVERMNQETANAIRIQTGAYELSQLSNDYILNREARQRIQWETKHAVFSNDLSTLHVTDPKQQELLRSLKKDDLLLNETFSDVSKAIGETNSSGLMPADEALIADSWSRMAIPGQHIVFEASQLAAMFRTESDRVQKEQMILVYILVGSTFVLLLVNFLLVYRHIMKEISVLETGTRIIGSGDLDFRIDEKGDDEFQNLASSFNQMAARRKASEYDLRELSAYNRRLIESSIDPLLTISHEGKILDVNTASERATGAGRNELIGTDFSRYFTDPERAKEGYRQAFISGNVIDYPLEIRHRDGHTVPVLYNATTYHDNNGNVQGVFAAARDITRIRQGEEALHESEEKFRSVFEGATDSIFLMNSSVCVDCNTITEKIYRCSRNQIIGHSPIDRSPQRQPDGQLSQEKARERISLALSGEPQQFEWIHLRCDGTRFFAEVKLNRLFLKGEVYLQAIVRDISERKKAEEQRESLIRELARKNAELDRFTYTVSHDLKSPLVTIRGYLGLLGEDLKNGNSGEVTKDVTRISESAEKLERLITTLLALSRSGRSVDVPVSIPLADLVREAAGLLEASLRERSIALVIHEPMPVVYGDRVRLLQVMTNLLDNSVKFMGDQKEPRIEAGIREDAGVPFFFIRDNGLGIRKEDLPKVFGLFERFNPEIPGTGIGLSTVKRIIEAHGGKIRVESEGELRGTTVLFTLPAACDACTDKYNSG
jgi:PAS domain S-box-containing protein